MGEPIATVGDLAGVCGYDGDAWRKLGMLWGYNARLVWSDTDPTVAGDTVIITPAVDEGKLHVVQAVSLWHTDTVARLCQIVAYKDADELTYLFSESVEPYPAMGVAVGSWVLAFEDVMRCYFRSTVATKNAFFSVWGYVMELAM